MLEARGMSEKLPDQIYHERRDCFKKLLSEILKKICHSKRSELKRNELIEHLCKDIAALLHKQDKRFKTEYYLQVLNKTTYRNFITISLGSENPSIYLHKLGQTTCKLSTQAESTRLWRKFTIFEDGTRYLNVSKVKSNLYRALSKAIKEYKFSESFQKHQAKYGIDSVTIDELCNFNIHLSNYNYSKTQKLKIRWIPSIEIPTFCHPYMQNWMGSNVPSLIGTTDIIESSCDPSLVWSVSYHRQIHIKMQTYPIINAEQAFYAIIALFRSDPVLIEITHELVQHCFLETVTHMNHWIDSHYERDHDLKDKDLIGLIEISYHNFLQKLEVDFLPNYFNPEINMLNFWGLTTPAKNNIISRLKSISRGNCECCRLSIDRQICNFIDCPK